MSLYVVITYDLKNASDEYRLIQNALASVDFKKVIVSKRTQKINRLPANTFVRRFDSDDTKKSKAIRKYAVEEIKRIFKANRVKGKYFVFVGKQWAWKVGMF